MQTTYSTLDRYFAASSVFISLHGFCFKKFLCFSLKYTNMNMPNNRRYRINYLLGCNQLLAFVHSLFLVHGSSAETANATSCGEGRIARRCHLMKQENN